MDIHFNNITKKYKLDLKNGEYMSRRCHHPYTFSKSNEELNECDRNLIDVEKCIKNYNNKYNEILNHINKMGNGISKKYQTLGYKQAKEILRYCQMNNITCEIVVDDKIKRNKLSEICVLYDDGNNVFNSGYEDYGNEGLDFKYVKQNVVYVKITK